MVGRTLHLGSKRLWGALALFALLALIAAGCGEGAGGESTADRFDANRAWRLVELQLESGQRPAGSPQLRKLATKLRPRLPDGRFEALPGEPGLRNVVGTLPGRKPGIVLGAHYDTLAKPRGFVGANNGAAGSAIVVEAARALRGLPAGSNAREVRFVLFDGEEPAEVLPEETANFYEEGLRGSRAYVAANPNRTGQMILLDYVGHRGLLLPREGSSTESLWNRLLVAANVADTERFFSRQAGTPIEDDHTPFLRAGVPAVDLIDWRYPGHSLADGLDRLSRTSLDAVGETVVQLVSELREE
ncbi:MAG TPA: M28 family metallopeptidase [Solirubrobacterales bacterium]|nr:M28 family metallopeptidase [Solirubrobacterales bacterium]